MRKSARTQIPPFFDNDPYIPTKKKKKKKRNRYNPSYFRKIKSDGTILFILAQRHVRYVGADPGFLDWGFVCIKVWVGRIADIVSFFLNIS